MSTVRAAAALLGRVAVIGAAGGAAVIGSIWVSSGAPTPPADLPVLAETPPSRTSQLAALSGSSTASPFDVLVIGGGATGTGAALDAATRGLRVALVERFDFASGTSSRSTKLAHGGVRYLEKAVLQADPAQLKLVYQALRERATLLRNAPHLTWPLPTVMPCYEWIKLPYNWAGLKVYDLLAGPNVLLPSRFATASEAQALIPTLSKHTRDGRTLRGALVYTDGQMDDARVNLALATTAARAGAVVVNHVEVVRLNRDPVTGRINSATVRDNLTGKQVEVHAKVTVNATGVYADKIRKMANPNSEPIMCTSSGTHIIFPEYYLGRSSHIGTGLIIPKTADGRVLFALPWLGSVVAGTTDEACDVTDNPLPTASEVSFIVDTLRNYLDVDVSKADVISEWSGLRPLIRPSENKGSTENVVREHLILSDPESGLLTIAGGKWTTYRSMAEETVDAALKASQQQGTPLSPLRKKSVTEFIPLTGAEGYHSAFFSQLSQSTVVIVKEADGKLRPRRLDIETAKHLAQSYGVQALNVINIANEEKLGSRLASKHPFLEAEVAFSARYEMCMTASDYLLNRSRLAFLDAQAALDCLPRVVELLGKEHGWSSAQRKQELLSSQEAVANFKRIC